MTLPTLCRPRFLCVGVALLTAWWWLVLALVPPAAWGATYYATPSSPNNSCSAATDYWSPLGSHEVAWRTV